MLEAQAERYRIIAFLLQYPEPAWLQMLPEASACSLRLPGGRPRRVVAEFMGYLAKESLLRLQENYTAAFDLNPGTTMNMSYHLLGDGRERAALLAQLQQSYRYAGFDGPADDLPDFLPAMVEFLAVCRDAAALEPFRRCLAGLEGLVHRLREVAPPYADLLELLCDDQRQWGAVNGPPSRSHSAPRDASIDPRPPLGPAGKGGTCHEPDP